MTTFFTQERAPNWFMANVFAVPGTGIRRGRATWLRRPRNVGVKKLLLADTGTLRGMKVPPSAWDDICRTHLCDRNWKRFRKTRWHRVAT